MRVTEMSRLSNIGTLKVNKLIANIADEAPERMPGSLMTCGVINRAPINFRVTLMVVRV